MGIVISCAFIACGQELVLPNGNQADGSQPADAPSEGFTGAGGASDEAEARPRLPVTEGPIFTTFGGVGGDGGSAADDTGTPNHGGTSPQKSGEGGRSGSAGTSGKNAGGTGGVRSSGGTGSTTVAGEASGGADGVSPGPAALMFSEYVEGSGSFKALEIYALAPSSLEGCELQTYSNGKLEPSRLALHGQLERGEVQVLCSSSLANALPAVCDRPTNLSFNGDDAVALGCAGQILDVIGQIGVDPGDAWGAGATLDHTLRRRCDVLIGRSDGSGPFDVEPEWLTLEVDKFSDLGVRNCTP